MDIFDKLLTLNAAFGPAGDESGIADVIKKLAEPFVDEITSDVMGNLICHKKGTGPKVMFAAHMDSLGLVVTHIEKEGFLRVGKLGFPKPQNIIYTPVRFKNGLRGAIAVNEGVFGTKIQMDDLYLDIGVSSEEEARKLVKVGDAAVYDTPAMTVGDSIISPYLDNRICCAALLVAMEQIKETDNDLYFVFTTQEELGMRGVRTAAYAIDPDYGICVDVN
jgi:endoglucanase